MRTIVGFDWDSGNWPKCARHGATKQDIENVLLAGPMVLPDRTGPTTEIRFNAVGRTREGRHLFVVFTLRERATGTLIRPISARYMHAKEVQHYERREER
jgi:uncharacterized DUF497 family protein